MRRAAARSHGPSRTALAGWRPGDWLAVGCVALVVLAGACGSAVQPGRAAAQGGDRGAVVGEGEVSLDAAPAPPPAAGEVTGLALLVDDAATQNPDLRPTPLEVPPGLSFSPREVLLPPGFTASVLATNIPGPRFMAFDDAGSLLVASPASGSVYRYPAVDGVVSPAARPPATVVSGLDAPSNVAFYGGYLYVGETSRISRYPYATDGAVGAREDVVPNLPSGTHNTRTVAFGPDGKMYVAVGSSCNICDETDERRAAILRFNPDGSAYERFAWGLRNPVGLAFQPLTGLPWTTVNERDNQGNEIPPDLFTIVRAGEDFGWPRCVPPNGTPQRPGTDCAGVTPPTVGIQAHSAPLGTAFYTGAQFPSDYQGDAFVAQHGSWNRQPPAPPKVLRVRFENGRPVEARDFVTGWQADDGSRWGRTAGVIVAPDGSLVISDDQAGVLYRVSYGT